MHYVSLIRQHALTEEKAADYIVLEKALDSHELEELHKLLKRKRPQPAKMKNEGAGESDDERKARYADRDSSISWFKAEVECPLVYQRLLCLVREANTHWPIIKVCKTGELECTYEEFCKSADLFLTYQSTSPCILGQRAMLGEMFCAKLDAFVKGNDPEDARQMTVVLMLSKQSEYTGGSFQAKVKGPSGKKVTRAISFDAGDALIFPSKRLMHRVSVVKTGLRKTLVFWAWENASCRFYTDSKR
eukprot:g29193.t1